MLKISSQFQDIYDLSKSNSWVERQLITRAKGIQCLLQEVVAETIITGAALVTTSGFLLKLALKPIKWIFPCKILSTIDQNLADLNTLQYIATKISIVALSILSTAVFGIVINPEWNLDISCKLGLFQIRDVKAENEAKDQKKDLKEKRNSLQKKVQIEREQIVEKKGDEQKKIIYCYSEDENDEGELDLRTEDYDDNVTPYNSNSVFPYSYVN